MPPDYVLLGRLSFLTLRHLLSLLAPEETAVWLAAREAAEERSLLFMAHPMHCVVGRKAS